MINTEKKTYIRQGLDKWHRPTWLVIQDDRVITDFPFDVRYLDKTAHQMALDWVAKKYDNPPSSRSRNPQTLEEFEKLTPCKVFSPCGPCLGGYRFVRKNKHSVTVAEISGREIRNRTVHGVHFKPCNSCHGGSNYPHGYMD